MARQPLEKYYPHVQGGDLIREADLVSPDEDGLGTVRTIRGTFDFAVDGGGAATHLLLDENRQTLQVPDNAIVLDGMVDVLTTFTSPTGPDNATIAIQLEGANDIVTAVAINDGGNPWDAGRHDIIPVGTAATTVKTTQARSIAVVIGVEAITAGKLTVFLRYVVSD